MARVTRKRDYEKLKKLALKHGADRASLLPASKVVIDDRIRLKCQVPLCENYFHNLMCFYAPDVERMERIVKKYSIALLVQTVHPMTGPVQKHGHDSVTDAYASSIPVHKLVNKLEEEAMVMGFGYVTGFIGGPCKLCKNCVGPFSNKKCRHPFLARPSMEAVGMDVALIAKNAGIPFEVPAVKEVVWNGIILIE
jgi:predicted metal-binding protein